ncbi:MAG TPA: DUF5666 domain-containing protein [Candidatus Eisenbacteria bacterium]|nr:DUF5666 domain-containing protein [Candidatus Eisenbacteria bacterium]
MPKKIPVLVLAGIFAYGLTNFVPKSLAQTAEGTPSSIAKRIGTVKSVSGNTLTLGQSAGPDVTVTVQSTARMLRLAPGEKDLKNATPIQVQDIQAGDTVRVRGTASPDGTSFNALEVIVITKAAVAAVSDQIKQDWQKRGVGGRVESVDAADGNVNLVIPSLSGKKTLIVHTTPGTVIYRYAADSPKPEDAKKSSLQEIQPGDQLRARGNRNAEGSEITAEEIFAGSFPQFAATVKSVDASAGIVTVQDLASKKTIEVKVTGDSQVRKIPAEMAQMFAMRLKGFMPAGAPGAGGQRSNGTPPAGGQAGSSPAGNGGNGAMGGGGGRQSGPPDLQRIISRLPSSSLADLKLQKGDAVIILATEGTASSAHTAITLLSGVEPILQAAPSAGQAMMLTPWNLGGGAPGGDASQ